jgi:hypothetical protein
MSSTSIISSFVFILEENGVFIKTTDDTTVDNYIAQGMYKLYVNTYILCTF